MGRHREWRAVAKKLRRKRIRQKAAQDRDAVINAETLKREASPSYQTWLSTQRALELFQEEEEARLSAERNAKWLEDEAKAQKLWSELQEKLAAVKAERARQELLIQEEWKEEQRKVKEAEEERKRKEEIKREQQELVLRQIEELITMGAELPPELNVASETNPNQPVCPFFSKTGACRFGDRCSRNHARPGISRVLLIRNFYDHFNLRLTTQDEFDNAEISLEYDESETYQHFLEFFEDVVPEFERIGRVCQFKVCCNHEPHLRGNVYIEYDNAHDAVQAFKAFNGRWYAGRQLGVEFVNVKSWRAAICGQFHRRCCPKGRTCNFLHTFANPNHRFAAADRDQQAWRTRNRSRSRSRSRSRPGTPSPSRDSRNSWRWSASPPPTSAETNGRSDKEHSSERRRHKSSSRTKHRNNNQRRRSTSSSRSSSPEDRKRKKKKKKRSSSRDRERSKSSNESERSRRHRNPSSKRSERR